MCGKQAMSDFQGFEVALIDTMRPSSTIDSPSSSVLAAGHVRAAGKRPLPNDIRFEHNRAFAMRDGVKLRVDIFRPESEEPVPAILSWSPYGKTGSGPLNLEHVALRVGVARSRLSGYESFEGLDPAEWVGRGYAIVNVDARGAGDSDGDLRWWGTAEAEDGYDLIEHIAAEPWCTGRVALAGNSWLAMSQWSIATLRPPHLAAIAPLEGSGDMLRETLARGCIPNLGFSQMIQHVLPGRQKQEDVISMLEKYPDRNWYWDDKRPDLSKIEVPAYILGSYSTNLHTLGSFRGFSEIVHANKWLTVHSTQEWYDLYSSTRTEDLATFFDFYLKDIRNGWDQTPPLRMSVLGFNHSNQVHPLSVSPWEQPWSTARKLLLYPDGTMAESHQGSYVASSTVSYQADAPCMNRDDDSGELLFKFTFPEKTILAGPSRVVLHLSAEKQNDLDVYVQLRKANAEGEILQSMNIPLSDLGVSSPSEVPALSVLKYLGPSGMIRASRRSIASDLSCSWWDTLSHSGEEKIPVGTVVRLQIPIWPSGIVFEGGEALILKVAGHDMRLVDFQDLQGSFQVINEGKHFVHFAGQNMNSLEFYCL